MPWFYDSRTGAYAEEAGVLGWLSVLQSKFGLGWHEYPTQSAMLAAIRKNHWPAPNNHPSNPVGKTVVGGAESSAAGNLLGLQLPSLMQVGEMVAGGIMLFIALNAMTSGGAGRVVRTVRKVAR